MVSTGHVKATVRALLPLLLTLCCLVFGLAATPPVSAGAQAAETPTPIPTDSGATQTGNVTLYDAGDATFDDASDVEAAIENGTLDRPDRMVVNETLVVALDSERLADAMAAHDGSTTERFLAALDGDADVRFLETYPPPNSLRMFATVGPENVTVSRNGTTVYAVVDTGDLRFRRASGDGRTYSVDSFYEDPIAVSFGFGLPAPRDVQRGAEPAGPVVEFWSEEYVETPTPTQTPPESTPAGTATVTLYDAGNATFDDADGVAAAVEDGRLDRPDGMVVGETLVVAIESDLLVSSMPEHDGSTTRRFLDVLDGGGGLYVVQTNNEPMVTRTFTTVGPANLTAYRDGSVVYALLDTDALVFRKALNDTATRRVESLDEDRFAVSFGFDRYEPRWDPPNIDPPGPTVELFGPLRVTATTTPAGTTAPPTAETTTRSPTAGTTTPPSTTVPDGTDPVTGAGTASDAEGPGFTVAALVAASLLVGVWRTLRS